MNQPSTTPSETPRHPAGSAAPVGAGARSAGPDPGLVGAPLPTSTPPRRLAGERGNAAPPGGVTARAVLIGLVLIPANTWWLAQIEYVRYSDNATTSSLFFNAIAILLLLLLLNAALHRAAPRLILSPG